MSSTEVGRREDFVRLIGYIVDRSNRWSPTYLFSVIYFRRGTSLTRPREVKSAPHRGPTNLTALGERRRLLPSG